jgi:hypothetical protein
MIRSHLTICQDQFIYDLYSQSLRHFKLCALGKSYGLLVGKPEGRGPLGRPRRRSVDNRSWVRQRTIPSDRRLSAKLVPTFAYKRCHTVSVKDPYGRILGFLDRNRYYFFKVAPQLYWRGWVEPVPDPLIRKSGSAGNRTRTSGSVAMNFDH